MTPTMKCVPRANQRGAVSQFGEFVNNVHEGEKLTLSKGPREPFRKENFSFWSGGADRLILLHESPNELSAGRIHRGRIADLIEVAW